MGRGINQQSATTAPVTSNPRGTKPAASAPKTAASVAKNSGKVEKIPGLLRYPANISDNLSIVFCGKELNLGENYAEIYEKTKDDFHVNQTGEQKRTLAENLLRTGTTITSIQLPLPKSLQESVAHSWGAEKGVVSGIVDAAKSTEVAGGVTVGQVAGGANQLAANVGMRAPTTDPAFFQNYSGTEPRRFSFSWDFVITGKQEANLLMIIFKAFKMISAPSQTVSNAMLMPPNFWIVQVNNKIIEDSIRFQPIVITSVEIDYAASGEMDVYKDGMPKFMKLSIACQEINAITRQTYGVAGSLSSQDAKEAINLDVNSFKEKFGIGKK